MNKTTVLAILLIIMSIIITGCTGSDKTIKTPEGDIKISQGPGSGPDWCKAGTQMTSSGPQGQTSFVVKGITAYQGREVCEMEWLGDEQITTTQYFNKDGSFTAVVTKDKDGNVIQEFNYTSPGS